MSSGCHDDDSPITVGVVFPCDDQLDSSNTDMICRGADIRAVY